MIDEKNVLRHELIGLQVEVVQSRNDAEVGIRGKIVDETQKTLIIRQDREYKRLFKENIRLTLNKKFTINGADIVGRPWDRIKNG